MLVQQIFNQQKLYETMDYEHRVKLFIFHFVKQIKTKDFLSLD